MPASGVLSASPSLARKSSVGYPSFTQASRPPSSGQTFLNPLLLRRSANLALVASFGQVQYITTGLPCGISS